MSPNFNFLNMPKEKSDALGDNVKMIFAVTAVFGLVKMDQCIQTAPVQQEVHSVVALDAETDGLDIPVIDSGTQTNSDLNLHFTQDPDIDASTSNETNQDL